MAVVGLKAPTHGHGPALLSCSPSALVDFPVDFPRKKKVLVSCPLIGMCVGWDSCEQGATTTSNSGDASRLAKTFRWLNFTNTIRFLANGYAHFDSKGGRLSNFRPWNTYDLTRYFPAENNSSSLPAFDRECLIFFPAQDGESMRHPGEFQQQ